MNGNCKNRLQSLFMTTRSMKDITIFVYLSRDNILLCNHLYRCQDSFQTSPTDRRTGSDHGSSYHFHQRRRLCTQKNTFMRVLLRRCEGINCQFQHGCRDISVPYFLSHIYEAHIPKLEHDMIRLSIILEWKNKEFSHCLSITCGC